MTDTARPRRPLTGAFLASPGPATWREALTLALKGFLMGVADIIPGVSGGTMAFITGIYEQLVAAIRSFDLAFVCRLARLDLAAALAGVHLRFLLPLLCGIGLALLSMARLMHYLLAHHPLPVWSLFFGLIAASIVVVVRWVRPLDAPNLLLLAVGVAVSYVVVGLIPMRTPETMWFLFLCGMVAICAMILPGISGAFLLLILGKYEYVTGALRSPLAPDSFLVLLVFAAGCLVGITGFSRLLGYLLVRHHARTLAVLAGFMIGAMRRIWPWKEIVTLPSAAGPIEDTVNILPAALDGTFFLAVGFMLAGAAAVLLIEAAAGRKRT
jgi:putative membrane protein